MYRILAEAIDCLSRGIRESRRPEDRKLATDYLAALAPLLASINSVVLCGWNRSRSDSDEQDAWNARSLSLLQGNTERAGVQTARHSVIVHRHDGSQVLERRRPAVDKHIVKPMFTRHYAHWPPARPRSLSVPRTSVYANLEASARRDPGHCALDYYGDRIAYAELRRQVDALAGFLQRRLGIERGDRVLLYTQNSPQYVIGYYAILRADAVVVPVNPMNRTEEVRHYLEDAGARVIIATQELWGEIAPLLGTSGLEHVVLGAYSDYLSADHLSADHGSGPSGLPVPEFVRAPRQAISAPGVTAFAEAVAAGLTPREHLARDHDLAVMPYTSGTTGKAKGCIHTHLSVQATASAIGAWRGDARQSVVLAVLPLFHVTGMQSGMNTPLQLGSTIVLMTRWDRDCAARLVERTRVTTLTAITTMMVDFLANPELDRYDLSSLSWLGGGGAAMPEAVARLLEARIGLPY
ncbi:MAG: AMP-binding protein, partial [Gammaproteobacteria bacterium]